jgi:hypothetical protein
MMTAQEIRVEACRLAVGMMGDAPMAEERILLVHRLMLFFEQLIEEKTPSASDDDAGADYPRLSKASR